ncbi:MAG: cupin domain-containing protein [Candidatus Thiodiazotropha sp. (ex Dulcina madagascariensis)]|nr:cupin domain-containing protein [Candidatus Thiodiazotropha sp. (ex Dulcina madagascariensis)]MCU7925919.1 cupin domain-containing protein [Candidatus Thiodiazotropha sp. (ex Dulcina madagascariensis)]
MQAMILKHTVDKEYFFQEGCFINELSNHPRDNELSIARVRVRPGDTTQWHSLRNTTERYLILHGRGLVEVGDLPPEVVTSGDAVLIPPGAAQRIANTGEEDLIFLALCTPRFVSTSYQALE